MNVRKPVRMSLSRQVLAEMEQAIASGRWPVGGRIPPEPELVRTFGVSRNTVREAVQSLIHAGILEARPGDGTYVLADSRLEVLMNDRLRAVEAARVLEARLALEKEIARLAAANRTDADLDELDRRLAARNATDRGDADMKFHMAVAAATHNPILAELYGVICKYLENPLNKLAVSHNDSARAEEIALHNDLAAAIRSGDADTAENLSAAIVRFYGELLN